MIVEKCKAFINNSFYLKKVKDNKTLIIISLVLAIICTMITYPGILYSDSYARIKSADTLIQSIKMVLTGQGESIYARSWLTIIPSLFMAVCKYITGNIATYTVLQAFVFFFMTFLLIKKFNTSYKIAQYLIFALSPLIFCVSVYYEPATGCTSGIVGLILLLNTSKETKSYFDRTIELLLIVLFSFITFGYRANALTIIPVLVVYVCLLNCKKIRKVITLSVLLFGIVLVSLFPKVFKIDTMSSSVTGLVWEIITVIQHMEPEKQAEYLHYLDEIGGDGATVIAIETSHEESVNGFLWGDGLNTSTISENGASSKVLKKYVNMIMNEPAAYFKVKWNFTMKTLGINQRVRVAEYYYNSYDRMGEYGFSDTWQRQNFVNLYLKTSEIFGFFICRPLVVLIISIMLLMFEWLRKDEKRKLYLFVLLIAVFYYGAFIVNTQSFELRYFYPSLYLMLIMDLAIVGDIVKCISTKLRKGEKYND